MGTFVTIEEEVVRVLVDDANVKTIIDTDTNKRIFVASLRPQTKKFPMLSVDTDYGPEEPAIHALNGICTIMMEFKELQNNGKPTEYSQLSLLKQHILDALSKKSFGSGNGDYSFEHSTAFSGGGLGIIVNKFLLTSDSEPIFDLEDKVWRWPLIFDFVHRDILTVGRVGV